VTTTIGKEENIAAVTTVAPVVLESAAQQFAEASDSFLREAAV
jgi:hypothetical protein